MKKVTILGSTGSIGRQALEVIAAYPERLRVVGLVARKNIDLLEEQIRLFHPEVVAVEDKNAALRLAERAQELKIEILAGEEGVCQVAADPRADLVLNAMVGAAGLRPTLAAICAGKNIALANKETLVVAGEVIREEVQRRGITLVPVDSEHSAIWQCLQGAKLEQVAALILTASGGPFREMSWEEMRKVRPDQALRHPSWRMGAKITVDSATMMNKGLEIIEAHWLFQIPFERIRVVIHPESVIHSMVEMIDGSVLAQMAVPDMRLPIQYALSYPERWENKCGERLDLVKLGSLHFQEPDGKRFPALTLALEAGRAGGLFPAVLNAANEVAVYAFLAGRIGFLDIPRIVAACLNRAENRPHPSLEELLEADAWARREAERMVATRC